MARPAHHLCVHDYMDLGDREGVQVMRIQRKGGKTSLLLELALIWFVSTALAPAATGQALIHAVDAVGMTVADMDRSLAFYTQVLSFEPVSDVEVTGSEYEHL